MPDLVQRSFTSGELAPSLRSRVDINKYQTGMRLCENFITLAQGGVYNRPGTRFVGEVADSTKRARLIPFSFSTAQTYILVFEHLKMRVIKNGAYIESSPGVPYQIATTYTEAELPRLYFTQSADVMTLCHPAHDPATLSRVTETNWVLATINYASTVAAPTVTSISGVGTGYGTYSKTYDYVVTKVDAAGVESLPSSNQSLTISSLTTTGGIRLTMSASPGTNEYYRIYKDPSTGSGVYGWIGDTKTATFDDYNLAPITSDSPPSSRAPFTGTNNKPSTVTYYQQRQIFANTNNEPQTIFTTQTGNYKSMRTSIPSRSDDAVTITIAARQVNEIRHLLPLNALIIMTSGGEWRLTEGQNQVLEPASVGVRPQTFNGASWVPPVIINNTALFVQEKGARVRDLGYEFASDAFTGNDLSLLSEHMFYGHTIEEMAYCAEPYGILWCVRNDGTLLGLTYQREHQVWGWHRHTTDGVVESVASISESGRDALYMVVRRTINGASKRYIERMEPREKTSSINAFFVDSGLSYNGAPATVMSGLGHLEGKAVACIADGNVVTGLTVSGGSVTLPRAASVVHIGLPYTSVIETLDIDTPSPPTVKAKSISVSKVTVEVEATRGGWVGPIDDTGPVGTMLEIKPRFESDGYDSVALKTFKQDIHIDPAWTRGGGIRVEQRVPLPMAILSVIPHVDVGG